MASIALCLFSLLAFSHAAVLPFFDPRIIGGENAREGEIPYQVSLQEKYYDFHFCGGSILNDNYVITAAHCVDGKEASDIKVVAATINLRDPKSQHEVEKIIVHREYDPSNSYINDIALVKVKTAFKTSVTVAPVPLPKKGHDVNTNDVAVVSGWGTIRTGGPSPDELQRVNILIADQAFCNYVYQKDLNMNVYPTQVCANDPSAKKGACNGDSGGPLTVNGELVGIVSWSLDCALTTHPTVYTRVISYLDWIENNAV
ncbi:trypsin-1 [Solenopsis invicta]|uniref:trypsin-1 n=1 Tax=Solenopsis invicta TaxID=13686 RepID=UPI000E33F7C7|nr:trypsin-1 [Solenopsis invicta]